MRGPTGRFFRLLSRFAILPFWNTLVILVAVSLWRTGEKKRAILLAASPTVEIPTAIVKALIRRPRPANDAVARWVSTASFPSGHVVRTLVTLTLWIGPMSHLSAGQRVASILGGLAFLFLMSLARVASGEHWPSDVMGSYLLGGIWLNVLWLVWTWRGRNGLQWAWQRAIQRYLAEEK